MFSSVIQLYIVLGAAAFGFLWLIKMSFLDFFKRPQRRFIKSNYFDFLLIALIIVAECIHYQNREYKPMEITLRTGERIEDVFRFNIGDIYETPNGRKIHKSEIKLIIVPLSDIDKANP